jgi:4-hydroxybenzoate polyprenyltransferase
VSTGRARAWLEIMRVSNLPTVVSNAIAGTVLGVIVRIIEHEDGCAVWIGATPLRTDGEAPSTTAMVAAIVTPALIYIAGMVLNDAFDAAIDAEERPGRPIPSGRLKRSHAFAAGFGLLAAAIALSTMLVPAAFLATLVLCAAVIAYDRFHSRSIGSTLLLALCRALASLIPMLANCDGDIEALVRRGAIALPLALAGWTLGLSLVARSETRLLRDDGAAHAPMQCPRCSQLMHASAGTCPECGRASDDASRRAFAEMRSYPSRALRALIPAAGTLVILLGFLIASTSLMQHQHAPIDPLTKLPWIGSAIALACAALASRALVGMRRDPRSTPASVGTWIACLALIDGMALGVVGAFGLAAACTLLAGVTMLLQRRIAGS